jgi:hypothetical protein
VTTAKKATKEVASTTMAAAETAAHSVRKAIAATVTAAEHVVARAAQAMTPSKAQPQTKRRATRTRTVSAVRSRRA